VGGEKPRILVTAHLDEVAMVVRQVRDDGRLVVGPLGGLFPWKLGEGPVFVMSREPLNGVLSFGSIHTSDKASNVRKADHAAIDWEMAAVVTGLTCEQVRDAGVRPGTRIAVHPSRRNVVTLGGLIGSYFLDDRADLVSWLFALSELGEREDVLFAATVSEEVGGEGALYLMQDLRPEVCIALELGPNAPDAPVELNCAPTVWATDSYATMSAADGDLIADLGIPVQFQALTRGGSDASCAASHGLCARPVTLGLPMDNTHGFEVMHPDAMAELAKLTTALVRRLLNQG
jgi:putative aminopeptidase FrvX